MQRRAQASPRGKNVIKMGSTFFLDWGSLAPALHGSENLPRALTREDHHVPPLSTVPAHFQIQEEGPNSKQPRSLLW